MTYKLAVIGAGNMAEAIVRGVIRSGVLAAGDIIVADVAAARRELFTRELGVQSTARNADAARDARVVLLSVKPQQMADALAGLAVELSAGTLIISIAAGISTRFIEQRLGQDAPCRVVRAMPNTPMLVGQGMTALARGACASAADVEEATRIFRAAGDVSEVPEAQLDAVTAVSGSGPAYFFFLVEQMIAAGVELGLSPEQARRLASQTALGAAQMLVTSHDPPEELRRRVTSPGGTTHAAITHMEQQGFPQAIRGALHAAAERSRSLGS